MTERLVERLRPFATTIFAEMSALAVELGAVNLGQGFPDTDGPDEVLSAAVGAIRGGVNQYPPGPGMAVLREAITTHQKRFYEVDFDPDSEVLVTAGATEGLAAALLGLLVDGDDVVCLEPMYDSYQACIALAGARTVPLLLEPPAYRADIDRLKSLVGPRTRAILVNSPHNPTGMVLTDHERRAIADVARERDLVIISDEVYEHIVFDGRRHESLLRDLMREGQTPSIVRRVVSLATQAADSGAGLIVFTCSSTSPAIDVAFRVANAADFARRIGVVGGEPASVVIWTTTPWTLPSNLALAVGPDVEYALMKDADGHTYVIADARVGAYEKELNGAEQIGTVTGSELEIGRAHV